MTSEDMRAEEIAREDVSQIKKRFVIVREPGKIPEKKVAIGTEAHVYNFVSELYKHRAPGTTLTVAELTTYDDLWLTDGRELMRLFESGPGSRKRRLIARHLQENPHG